jgi:hypothetical protein
MDCPGDPEYAKTFGDSDGKCYSGGIYFVLNGEIESIPCPVCHPDPPLEDLDP